MEEKLSERDILSIDAEKYVQNNNNVLFQGGYSITAKQLAAKLFSKCNLDL